MSGSRWHSRISRFASVCETSSRLFAPVRCFFIRRNFVPRFAAVPWPKRTEFKSGAFLRIGRHLCNESCIPDLKYLRRFIQEGAYFVIRAKPTLRFYVAEGRLVGRQIGPRCGQPVPAQAYPILGFRAEALAGLSDVQLYIAGLSQSPASATPRSD